MLNELAKEIHEANCEKGFYDQDPGLAKQMLLIVTEIAEAAEADREDHHADREEYDRLMGSMDPNYVIVNHFPLLIKNSFEDEIADAMIRLLDLAGSRGIDIDYHVQRKLEYNKTRPYKHGKRY